MATYLLNTDAVRELSVIVGRASSAIMKIYDKHDSWGVGMKSDASPLTQADLHVNQIIVGSLAKFSPEIPVLSEESLWQGGAVATYWAVDPLDGTKEFIKLNGEFTVNIALVIDGVARLGVICTAALGTLWAGSWG
jgi:3'(2'), 5'-bisphosphate nucleotidase